MNTSKNRKLTLIDSALVLKTLLEIYKAEKIIIFRLIREIFLS